MLAADPDMPLHELDDTLDLYFARDHRRSRAIYVALLLVVVGAVASLPLIRVEVGVGVPGMLRPVIERYEVRSGVSGVISEARVRRGDRVRSGELLALLDAAPTAQRMAALESRRREVERSIVDLDRLLAADPPAVLAPAALGTDALRSELLRLVAELAEFDLEIDQLGRESGRAGSLASRRLLSAGEAEAHEHRLRSAIARREALLARYRSDWAGRRGALSRESSELAAESTRTAADLDRHRLLAPIAGSIEELRVLTPGSLVQIGEVVAAISPDTSYVAEVLVSPRDVGPLRVGMPARIQVDAFDHLDWGHLRGEVVAISRDAALVDGMPVFRLVLALGPDPLRLRSGAVAELRKGMTIRARLMLGERSLLRLLRDDLSEWGSPWATPTAGAVG